MATSKEYGYQIKGNKFAIVEKDVTTLADGLNYTHSEGDGLGITSGNTIYKSPLSSITNGIQLEYVYSPKYSITTASTTQVNKFYINGWTVIDGYLTFVRSHSAAVPSWDSSPYSAVGDDEYIVVKGSSRWSGLHKVQTGGTDGTLKTYTRVHQSVPVVVGSSNIDIYGEGTGGASATQTRIIANDSSNIWLNALFSTNDYIFVTGSAVAKNNGFWQISGVQDDSSAESSSGIYVTNRYFCYDGDNTLSTEGEDTSPDTTLATDESVTIYKVYRDFSYIITDIDILNDEDDIIDLSPYLSKALVYYVKGRLMEDSLDLKGKEYFMKEFQRMVEKHESSKVTGPRQLMSGNNAIR